MSNFEAIKLENTQLSLENRQLKLQLDNLTPKVKISKTIDN